jgi:hypothetical protein
MLRGIKGTCWCHVDSNVVVVVVVLEDRVDETLQSLKYSQD